MGQPVRLEYKASEVIEPDLKTGKGGTKTKEEFNVEEAEFTGGHPENIKFEESVIEKFGEHASDFSEVEEFATGLKKGKGGSGTDGIRWSCKNVRRIMAKVEEYQQMMAWLTRPKSKFQEPRTMDFADGGRIGFMSGKSAAVDMTKTLGEASP